METNTKPAYYPDVEACVENTLSKIGKEIVLGIPLGLGKPNQLVNEFFRRACQDSRLKLKILTALTLSRPQWKSALDQRLIEPLSARIFGNYPELDYVAALRENNLPTNIEIAEFYFQPGKFLNNTHAQQNYLSSNYTHVVRDALSNGINVFAQLISSPCKEGETRYSLSCNSDLAPDLMSKLREREQEGHKVAILGQVNPELPFMLGDSVVGPEDFDAIVDHPQYAFKLFAPPNPAVSSIDYMIGLHASTLVKDGGTIQLGIGSLSDAVTYLIALRHKHNVTYHALLSETNALDRFAEVIHAIGDTAPFQEGLYAASEMFVDGFMQLYQSGILKRKVYAEEPIQRLINEKKITAKVTPETLTCFIEQNTVSPQLRAQDVALLQQLGVFKAGLSYENGMLHAEKGVKVSANLSDAQSAQQIYRHCLGSELKGGHLLHASFFLGSQRFYDFLRSLGAEERQQFSMKRISYVNELYGEEELKRLQRKEARFLNSALMVTLNGAIISDKLEDGRTLSGVGGQYNFVAMAHALSDARSIIMLRSVREKHSEIHSNILWNYGHVTIPGHLRDIVVTEYGIADLRGKSDREIALALLNIADSRFQESLLKEAQQANKIPSNYKIPDRYRNNYPERLERFLAPYKEDNFFPEFPFGTDLTQEEIILMKALEFLQTLMIRKRIALPNKHQLKAMISKPESAKPYLERLQLDKPKTIKEALMQKFILYALSKKRFI